MHFDAIKEVCHFSRRKHFKPYKVMILNVHGDGHRNLFDSQRGFCSREKAAKFCSFEMDTTSSEQDERDEIVRGFIIEKDYINQEHEKEKEEIVDSFIQEREELIDKFNKKVAEIEEKFHKTQQNPSKASKPTTKRPKFVRNYTTTNGVPLYLNFGGENLTAEEFLSNFQLEEKYEHEHDGLERSYRDEKRNLKDKLEIECEKKLQRQKLKYESMIDDFKRIVKDLKFEKEFLEKEYQKKTEDWKSLFEERRRGLESKYQIEQNHLRDSLEVKHNNAMAMQRDNYERMINELKEDHKRAKDIMNEREKDIMKLCERKNEEELFKRSEISEQLRQEFKIEFDRIVNEKSRLAEQVDVLTREKKQLSEQIKDIKDSKMYKMEILDEFSSRLNKEYEERLKNSILENEKLSCKVRQLQDDNKRLLCSVENSEKQFQLLEDKITSRDKLIAGFEEKITCLRGENNQLSNEVSSLRKEVEESRRLVENHCELQRLLNTKLSEKSSENQKVIDRCKGLEKERIGFERNVSVLNGKLHDNQSEIELLRRKLKQTDDTVRTSERLLSEERKEHERFIERFRCDADEIRKKDRECLMLKEKLQNIERKVERDIDTDAEKIDRVMQLEAQNAELRNELFALKEKEGVLLREERESMQKQFAKEFAKRLQLLRRNYEEATEGLIKQIRELRQRISELEGSMKSKSSKYRSNDDVLDSDYRPTVRFQSENFVNSKTTAKGRLSKDAVCDYECSTSPRVTDIQFDHQVPVKNHDLLENKIQTANNEDAPQFYRYLRRRSNSIGHYPEYEQLSGNGCNNNRDMNLGLRAEFYDRSSPIRHINGSFSALPPIDKRTWSKKLSRNGSGSSTELPSNLKPGHERANIDESQTAKLEKSVEKLQNRLETSHSQMMQRIDSIQNSRDGESCSKRYADQKDEELTKQKAKNDDKLHDLLQDVKSEVSRFTQLLEKQSNPGLLTDDARATSFKDNDVITTSFKDNDAIATSFKDNIGVLSSYKNNGLKATSHEKDDESATLYTNCDRTTTSYNDADVMATSQNNVMVTSYKDDDVKNMSFKDYSKYRDSNIIEEMRDLKVMEAEAKIARRYATEYKNQLEEKQIEVDDTAGALMEVYKNQDEITSGLLENRKQWSDTNSSKELIHEDKMKEGKFLDKIIAKLHERLLGENEASQSYKNEDNELEESSCDYMSV